jgi:putative SOS response-associated peptidase YedK
MCGKFTQRQRLSGVTTLEELLAAEEDAAAPETVTPMRFAEIVMLDGAVQRAAVRMRWGFVPAHADDPNIGTKFIHARGETIDEKPTFRDAFLKRRGLVFVETFNEGEEVTPRKTRQYIVRPCDGTLLAIAVIWERWQGRAPMDLLSFAMVTTPPNVLIGTITDRMPAVLPPEHWAKWLGEEPATVEELKALLIPFEGDWSMAPAEQPAPAPKPAAQAELF